MQADPPPGRKGYAICGEPRAGSNHLCQVLASTGRLGNPRDWFNTGGIRAKGWPDYPAQPARQTEMALTRGATANGIYGLKMFSVRFDGLAGFDWVGALPGLHFIHLERGDLLAQAVSDARATATGKYRSTGEEARPPAYDRRAISRSLEARALGQARWRAWFARNDVRPLHLVYEEVAADPQAAAEAVARLVGLAEPVRIEPGRFALSVQRDGLSEEWRARFLEEAADPARLDWLGPSVRDLLRRTLRLRAG